ncbi:CRISPR system precrRNA processing endoribonuclease RAMP protein Cas6 [Sporolituus thermophilus]|uniref:Uncharacterized conserved protein n=1 Tax=Sporolituus thermophilus DSM 23256 TaxID=1123285 RepID=A0A1G7HLH3_9FIRM|nr:CRISPR system precrRNA processing endoribonuclease RAMP protein Cas6 [Sporolituus thermophilus]SDF01285.1 Uncharacterized conserved protein [Sporolituus thermophilus DSM 23256]
MFDDFCFAVYELTMTAGEHGLVLPEYKGSTLRGGFGHVFRRIACVQRQVDDCRQCLLFATCPYALVFEPAPLPDSAVLKNLSDIPRPFVLEPPADTRRRYAPGEKLVFRLVLVGQVIELLPYFVLAFKELGRIGLGKGRLPCELTGVDYIMPFSGTRYSVYRRDSDRIDVTRQGITLKSLPAGYIQQKSNRLQLVFHTMTRLKHDHKLAGNIPFHVLVRNLLRRISTLYYFYHGGRIATLDYQALIDTAGTIATVYSDLQLVHWERFSNRQQVRMDLPGLVGEVEYEGNIIPFLPLLRLGEIIHVGKGCTFGLGKYEIKAVN